MGDVHVWTCDERQRVVHANRPAERLFGAGACGRPCHELVGGVDLEGRAVCRADCRVFASSRRDEAPQALTLVVRDAAGTTRALRVLPFLEHGEGGAWRLVHVAEELAHETGARDFLRVHAARVRPQAARDVPRAPLTPREHEILDRLARGADSKSLARELHVSYATVRNHVQHLLSKLGAHSILEAVAFHVLRSGGAPRKNDASASGTRAAPRLD